ncbi:ALR family protein [Klebsormidium nitens]|uniref:Sulfhydryl oxidase n=1 Tax=Klebsormidium nitens TaxID=105231 RepID=A0A1Y1I6Z1_KLENI|nr:ALR family protein [Klebsormidium nitens]|eukprot:GAQ86725.1 ALR family protein [Klebsormidium nitens]
MTMGPNPFEELAEKFRELQQGAGEHLGKLRQAAEALAANFDPKKREQKRREAAAESSSQQFGRQSSNGHSVIHRRGHVQGPKKVHPIAAVSVTEKKHTSKVIAKQQLVQDSFRGGKLNAVNSAALVVEKDEPIAEAPASAAVHAREELGRSTWTMLHMLAAQYPEQPTKQQQKDVKTLMELMTRIYPCKMCADHFKEVLKAHPVQADSGFELAQWMCQVHNVVNRSLNKPLFPCQRVDARWGALNCDEDACSLEDRSIK